MDRFTLILLILRDRLGSVEDDEKLPLHDV